MNKDNAHLYLPFVQALAEGKTIQIFFNNEWNDMDVVSFSADPHKYRIKPEPRVLYVNEYTSGYHLGYSNKSQADRDAVAGYLRKAVKYIEVVE